MADIPIYEIDPKKKYLLSFPFQLTREARKMIYLQIRDWLMSDQPILILMEGVRLIRVEDSEEPKS